jgi:DNA repair protein RecN (Recombination protein N)
VVAKRQTAAKGQDAARTESSVAVLDAEGRAQEVARMLGGERVSRTSLAHAREMLGQKTEAAAS